MVSEYTIRERGKNGTVALHADRIVRTRRKRVGKDDVQTIPLKAVIGVSHDRTILGTDRVKVTVGSETYEWKVKEAEKMVADLHKLIYG